MLFTRLLTIFPVLLLTRADVCKFLDGYVANKNEPLFPEDDLVSAYRIKFDVVLVNRKSTIEIREEYDAQMNAAVVITVSPGDSVSLIIDFNQQQTYRLDNKNVKERCSVGNVTLTNGTDIFGAGFINGVIYSTNNAVIERLGLMYIGNETLDDVDVDHWRSCMSVRGVEKNFTVDHYYTTSSTISADGLSRTPVRFIMEAADDEQYNYNVIEFKPLPLLDRKIYQVPLGVHCAGQKSSRGLPTLPEQYFYRQEVIIPALKVAQYSDIFYDYVNSIIRIDHRPPIATPPLYTTQPIKSIHDYTIGLAYVIDKINKNCTIQALKNTTVDAVIDDKRVMTLRLKSPLEMFYLDDTYIYKGKFFERGMMCDVFVSKRHDYIWPLDDSATSIFEIYFSDRSWVQINNDGVTLSQQVPVRLSIFSGDGSAMLEYHFYDFDEEGADFQVFDTSECYPEDAKKHVIVEFPGYFAREVLAEQHAFLTNFRVVLASVARISPSRVQDIVLSYDASVPAAYVLCTVVDRAPAFTDLTVLYSLMRGKRALPSSGEAYVLNTTSDFTEADCMEWCDMESAFPCNSFSTCPGKAGTCTMYEEFMNSTSLVDDNSCSFYQRSTEASPGALRQVNLTKAWYNIKQALYTNKLAVTVIVNETKLMEFRADQVFGDVIRAEFGPTYKPRQRALLSDFHITKGVAISGFSNQLQRDVTLDECANICVNMEKFVCHSFNYFAEIGGCEPTSHHPMVQINQTKAVLGCDNFARNFLDRFVAFPGLTVPPYLAPTKGVLTAPDCAARCFFSEPSSEECQSFYFCDYKTIHFCFLSSRRDRYEPDYSLRAPPACQFYQSHAMDWFAPMVKSDELELTTGMVINDVNAEQCAEICWQDSDCHGFDFCSDSDWACFIPMTNLTSPVVAPWKGKCPTRIHFERLKEGSTKPEKHDPPTKVLANQDGYDSGSMAGLAIAMLLAGALLGAAAMYIHLRMRNRRPDDEIQLTPSHGGTINEAAVVAE